MKLCPDTNVLVRILVEDDVRQAQAAQAALAKAEIIAVPTSALCEVVWVLARGYDYSFAEIAEALRVVLAGANVVFDGPAVEAGLAMLAAGGDFADGAIAYEGRRLGGEIFVSFDKKAVKRLEAAGERARVLG